AALEASATTTATRQQAARIRTAMVTWSEGARKASGQAAHSSTIDAIETIDSIKQFGAQADTLAAEIVERERRELNQGLNAGDQTYGRNLTLMLIVLAVAALVAPLVFRSVHSVVLQLHSLAAGLRTSATGVNRTAEHVSSSAHKLAQ